MSSIEVTILTLEAQVLRRWLKENLGHKNQDRILSKVVDVECRIFDFTGKWPSQEAV